MVVYVLFGVRHKLVTLGNRKRGEKDRKKINYVTINSVAQ